jgi:hypothetical protein
MDVVEQSTNVIAITNAAPFINVMFINYPIEIVLPVGLLPYCDNTSPPVQYALVEQRKCANPNNAAKRSVAGKLPLGFISSIRLS